MRPTLIGDIGGTNARLALVTPGEVTPHDILNLPCADYPGVIEAIQDYLARVGATGDNAPQEACLAFACPVHAERVKMTNNHWDFMKSDVQQALNLSLFKVINDFTAQALGVPHVGEDNLVEVQPGEAQLHSTRLVIGPGTGLGVAGIFPGQHAWIPLPTEGGHVTFAPTDTTAGGDAFIGGLLAELSAHGINENWHNNADFLRRAVDTACRCGAHAVTRPGAYAALPTRADID